jgi:hypothetical protein
MSLLDKFNLWKYGWKKNLWNKVEELTKVKSTVVVRFQVSSLQVYGEIITDEEKKALLMNSQ